MRGVVVGDDDDGADALLDQRALALVEGNHVLAARGGAELLHKVIAQVASHKGRHGERHQHKADDGQRHGANAHQQHAHKEHGKQNLVHDAAKGLGVKLLDGRLHAVSAHDVRDGLCGLVLLLAVCRSNPDVLVELVQVVMCHGHAVRPFGKSLMRLVRCCIQSRQYTAYGADSLKTRRCRAQAVSRGRRGVIPGGQMGSKEMTKDDEKVERIASLAAYFMQARSAVSSEAIHTRFYPSLSVDSFNRAFSRDRADLAICGLVLKKCGSSDSCALWKVDEETSYADSTALSPTDAFAFALACQPLLRTEGFPLSTDLDFALKKIYNYFDSEAASFASGHKDSREERVLRTSMATGKAFEMEYEDAKGQVSTRVIAPYGTFSFRERLYVVGPQAERDGTVVLDSVRTYRFERILKAKLTSIAFEVPRDFDISDHRKLPFQMGEPVCEGHFDVPEAARAEVLKAGARLADGQGELVAAVSSLEDAAAWAISVGARPTAPEELVTAWRKQLEGAVRNG